MWKTRPSTVVAEPPLGIFEAKCDDKGRLKLPVRFAMFLKHSDVSRVFITTTDLRSARIYPEKVWQSNQNFFDEPGEDTELAEDISFIANLYGDFSTLDEHGRVLVPTNLRRKLEFEKQSVWLENYRGHINVHPRKVYDERMARALAGVGGQGQGAGSEGIQITMRIADLWISKKGTDRSVRRTVGAFACGIEDWGQSGQSPFLTFGMSGRAAFLYACSGDARREFGVSGAEAGVGDSRRDLRVGRAYAGVWRRPELR